MLRRTLKSLTILLALLLLVTAAGAFYLSQRYVHPPARQAFINGHILTMDGANSVAEAVVLERDRILAVGSLTDIQPYLDADTAVVDLAGKTMMPGIIDAHSHFPGPGVGDLAVDLSSPPVGKVNTLEEVYALLREKVAHTPKGEWVFAYGFDDTLIAEQRYPQRLDLDAISSEHPIFIMHVSAHGGVANSQALALAGFNRETPDPIDGIIGRDPNSGELSGFLFEGPGARMRNLATQFAPLNAIQVVERASQLYLSMGVTTAQDGLLTAEHARALVPIARFNMLPLRLVVWPDFAYTEAILAGQQDIHDTPRLHFGATKLIIDGSLQACTGFLTKPYLNCGAPGNRGQLIEPMQEVKAQILRFHQAGRQLAVHTNGDAAMDAFLDAFAKAQAQHPVKDPRAILVHAQTMRPDQLDQARELGMTPSFFAAHVYYWGDRHRDIFLGPERAQRISPSATALAKNLRFTLHSDSPVVPMNPWLLAWSAVQRETASGKPLGPDERISALQALRAMTIDAAWQNFLETDRGSIEAGKYADLIILSDNPLSSPKALRDTHVLQTLVGGVTVYQR